MRKVYITGLGFITSIGNDLLTVAESLRDLRHGMVQYPPFQKADVPVKVAAPIRDFQTDSTDQEDWLFPARYSIRRETLRGMAPHGIYSYCAMQQAVEDAKLTEADWSNPQTGLYAASAGSPFLLGHHLEKMRKQGVMRCPPLGIVASISGTVNFNLVSQFKIKGASTGFSSACASSAHALGFAYDEIALGRQKRMFVIGAEDGNVESILPFATLRALSNQADPNQASRPFDRRRDGFVGTGGAVALIVEEAGFARSRGARVQAELVGWGQAGDGHSVAASHPEGAGLAEAMRRALDDPRGLAAASPVAATLSPANTGTASVASRSTSTPGCTLLASSATRAPLPSAWALRSLGISFARRLTSACLTRHHFWQACTPRKRTASPLLRWRRLATRPTCAGGSTS